MIEEIYQIQGIALAFAAVLGAMWLLMRSSEKPSRKRDASRIFACGVDAEPEELNVPSGSYYASAMAFLRLERLSRLHSGRLSDYMVWILIGAAAVLAYMVFA